MAKKNIKLVHRLDRQARGLILIAHGRSSSSAARFSKMFADNSIEKKYLARVQGNMGKPGYTRHSSTAIDNKPASTHVWVIRNIGSTSDLLVRIDTGRKHQIRRHLHEAGYPIIGDATYGRNQKLMNDMLYLIAFSMKFICPLSSKKTSFVLPEKSLFSHIPDKL